MLEIALDQCGPSTERKIAFIDKNRDLYLAFVRHLSQEPKICKIGKNEGRREIGRVNILSGTRVCFLACREHGSQHCVERRCKYPLWHPRQPADRVVLPERRLHRQRPDTQNSAPERWRVNAHSLVILSACGTDLYLNTVCVFCSDLGQAPQILSFVGTTVTLRQRDGSLVPSSVPHYPTMLHEYSTSARWEDAVQLCRFANVRPLLTSVWNSKEKTHLPSFSILIFLFYSIFLIKSHKHMLHE